MYSQTAEVDAATPLVVNTDSCISSKPLFSAVAAQLGWLEDGSQSCSDSQPEGPSVATLYCGPTCRQSCAKLLSRHLDSWVMRYTGLPNLCDKGNFARMAMACQALCPPRAWDFNPRSWLLPEQHELIASALQKGKHTYIFKPRDGSRGEGIFLARSLPEMTKNMSRTRQRAPMVCQQYLAKPLLLDGFKFDLRMYVCLLGGSARAAPHVFLCREGLARFCTERYEQPSSANLDKALAHLTNYSLNKTADNFKQGSEEMSHIFDSASRASKRPLTVALKQIEEEHVGFDQDLFYNQVVGLVQTTFAAMAPVISAFHRCDGRNDDMRAMHILGIDVILDRDFMPTLLEINNSPSLRISDPQPLGDDVAGFFSPAEVSIENAGTVSVNTSYTEGCARHPHYLRSFYSCDKMHGLHCAAAVDDCPQGWYITKEMEGGTYYNVYYHPNADPEKVPEIGWMVYKGQYAKPGFRPSPEIKIVSAGCDMSRDSRHCLCSDWHDMHTPHWHKVSMVDIAVKRIAVEGAFRLLQQVREGAQMPQVEAYIHVDIAGTDLYALLMSVEALFIRSGLQGDWRAPSARQRLRGIFGMFVEQHGLKVEELERLSSQSVYKYASDLSTGATPLQLFDFVELLQKVGSRAFATEPRQALNLLLSALEGSLTPRLPNGAGQSSAEEDEELVDM